MLEHEPELADSEMEIVTERLVSGESDSTHSHVYVVDILRGSKPSAESCPVVIGAFHLDKPIGEIKLFAQDRARELRAEGFKSYMGTIIRHQDYPAIKPSKF